MNPKRKNSVVGHVVCFVLLLLISVGCNNTQEYKYQNASDAATTIDVKAQSGTVSENPGGDTSTMAAANTEPAVSEVSVSEILQNDSSFNNRKIRVIGRIGKVFTHDKMAFLLNINNDRYVELSYAQMPESDKSVLTSRLVPLQKVTISGMWDASKKILVADGLLSPAM